MSQVYIINAKSPKWTKEETELLKELYARATKEEILKSLNRTWNAVNLKAQRLGLCRWSTIIDESKIEKQRLACRHYYWKNRERMLEAHKRYAERHRERVKKRRVRYLAECRKKVFEVFGTKCVLCGGDRENGAKIHFHEIHGNKHNHHYNYVLKHQNDFVPLCFRCHRMVTHMTRFGVTWQEIVNFLRPMG